MNYDAFRDMAVRLLRDNGRQLTFRRSTPGAFDKATGRPAAPAVITAVAYSLVLPFAASQHGFGRTLADQLQVREGEQLVLIAGQQMTVTGASTWEPLAGDALVTALPGGGSWKVSRVKTLDPVGDGSILHGAVIAQ